MHRSRYLVSWVVLATAPLLGQEFLAKILLEDGTPMQANPLILPNPTDACQIINSFSNGNVVYRTRAALNDPQRDYCPVMIRLAGYQKTDVILRDGKTVVLKRTNSTGSATISAATLDAPKPAVKAYEAGVARMNKQQWAEAQQKFEAAVALYPKYAPAWSDLGEVLNQQGKPQEARAAFERARLADAQFLKPYLELAKLNLMENRPQDAIDVSTQALEKTPSPLPILHFYVAFGHFNLRRWELAERAARQAIELDTNHQVPRAHHLLARILLTKADRPGAAEQFRLYLEYWPKAPDAAEVKRSIADLEGTSPKR